MAPISLLTAMTETSVVSGRIKVSKAETSTKPWVLTGAKSTSKPCVLSQSADSFTAGCSIAETMMCLPRCAFSNATPLMTQLSPSVPPEVKKISLLSFPNSSAICLRDASRIRVACVPRLCRLEGFPQIFVATSVYVLITSG